MNVLWLALKTGFISRDLGSNMDGVLTGHSEISCSQLIRLAKLGKSGKKQPIYRNITEKLFSSKFGARLTSDDVLKYRR